MISIVHLADCPQFVPVIASWVFDHWGKMYRMKSVDEQIGKISERLNTDRFPIAFVAMKGSEPVGTASLKIQEMTTHKHLYHWLGSVYVAPGCRRNGIGTALVRQAEIKAKELGVGSLYLHTPDMERFYANRGWVAIDRPVYFDMQVIVMEKVLAT